MKNIYKFILKQPVKYHLYIHQWLMQRKHEGDSTLCQVKPTLASPVINEYRNKCSFTIGRNQQDEVCVGHRIGKYRDNNLAVESVSDLCHIPMNVRKISAKLEGFVRGSEYEPYNRFNHQGHWQDLMVRNNSKGECLAVVTFCRRELEDSKLKKVEEDLKSCLNVEKMVDSLLMCYTKVRDRNDGSVPLKLVYGEGHLYESLFEYKFKVSPYAFFQCNTPACEVLYGQVAEMTRRSMKRRQEGEKKRFNVLLDVCCGTGTIGICLSKHFDLVYGVDICESAIVDAKKNAELNGVKNVHFIAGKAQDKMYEILKKIPAHANVVAVVDPPRDGLHRKVIESMRSREQIGSVVYVACSLKQTRENVHALVRNRSKKLAGRAFRPVACQPLDLFPHTDHVEVVTLYERFEEEKVEEGVVGGGGEKREAAQEEKSEEKVEPMEGEKVEEKLQQVDQKNQE